MPDDAAIGWQHPCETLTENGAHINEICAATQLCSPVTWSAKPVLANLSWEGNTWQEYNGVQSRPDHILLSVDLTAPPVTIEFRSSHTLRRTALASIDHAVDYELPGVFHGRCAAALGHSGGAQWQNCPWCPPAKLATATGVEISNYAVLGEFIENFDKPEGLSAVIDE